MKTPKLPGQDQLFNDAEDPVAEAETVEKTISYPPKKPTRKPLPEDLPREVTDNDSSHEEKVCGCFSGKLHHLGEDKSQKLQFIPTQVKVIEHVRPKNDCSAWTFKYSRLHCQYYVNGRLNQLVYQYQLLLILHWSDILYRVFAHNSILNQLLQKTLNHLYMRQFNFLEFSVNVIPLFREFRKLLSLSYKNQCSVD